MIKSKLECPQVQNDRRRPFQWPSWLSFIGQIPYMKFGRNRVINDKVKSAHKCKLTGSGHFVSHLGYRMWDKTHSQTWARV